MIAKKSAPLAFAIVPGNAAFWEVRQGLRTDALMEILGQTVIRKTELVGQAVV